MSFFLVIATVLIVTFVFLLLMFDINGEIEAVTVFYTGSDEIGHSNEFQITLSNMQFFNIIQQDETGHRIGSYHFIPC